MGGEKCQRSGMGEIERTQENPISRSTTHEPNVWWQAYSWRVPFFAFVI